MPRKAKQVESHVGDERISASVISRMRWYLYVVEDCARNGVPVITSRDLSERVGVKSGLVRKDLCQFGGFGRPSVGYNVQYLQKKLREILHISDPKKICWVGASYFSADPMRAEKYARRNCIVTALFDNNKEWIGKRVQNLTVLGWDEIEKTVRDFGIEAAIFTSASEDATEAVERLAKGGIKAIVNLSPRVVSAPSGVALRNVDIAGELLMLCFFGEHGQDRQ